MRLVGHFNRTLDDDAPDVATETPMTIGAPDPDDTPPQELWPAEVDLILSAMDAAYPRRSQDRRASIRSNYRTRAELKLFSDHPLDPPTPLYTRDVQDRGIGFITRQRLPLGYAGKVQLTLPSGETLRSHCTVYRCREAINGWFEGALHFSHPQGIGD